MPKTLSFSKSASGTETKPNPATIDARLQKLTARQLEILELIKHSIAHSGYPPTRAELAAQLGFRSINAAEEHIQALARKGAIELTPGASRGIRVTGHVVGQPTPQGRAGLVRRGGAGSGLASQIGNQIGNQIERQIERQLALPLASLAQLMLPLVGRVAAGAPILATEHVESTYTVEASLFAKQPDYLLTVRGMSMQGIGILDGDLLAVQQAKEAKNGQIVVARIDDEVTVKRFQRRGTTVHLLPENPDFKPIIVDERGGDFTLEGIAVGLIRNTPMW
jgi:repressor LexA